MPQQDEFDKVRNDLAELESQYQDLKQQLRMRESERDLLAVMLNEAENNNRSKPDNEVNLFVSQRQPVSATRYSDLLERVRVGLILSTDTGTIQTANRAVKTVTGYSRTELIGKNIATLFSETNDYQHVLEKIAALPSKRLIETDLLDKF